MLMSTTNIPTLPPHTNVLLLSHTLAALNSNVVAEVLNLKCCRLPHGIAANTTSLETECHHVTFDALRDV